MLIFGIDPCTIPSDNPGGGIAWINEKGPSCIKMPSSGRKVHNLIRDIIRSERVGDEPVVAYMENIPRFTREEEQEFDCPGCTIETECICNTKLSVSVEPKKIKLKVTPKHQVATMSKLYGGFKYLESAFDVRNITLNTVDARTWQKVVGVKRERYLTQTQWKNVLKTRAQFFYPELGKKITLKTADALLIMRYGWIMENQNNFF